MREDFLRVWCYVVGHKLMRTGVMTWLCMRCDSQVFADPIKAQAKRWGHKSYADRWKKEKDTTL